TFFMEPNLRNHRPGAVSVYCYSDVRHPDAVTATLRSLSIQWRDIAKLSDEQLDQMIRDDRIDILVDLTQHLAENRLTVFARKPAPIAVTYLGYPYATGLQSIDYRLSDEQLDPPQRSAAGPEKIARLPQGYFCYQPPESPPPLVGEIPSRRNGF